MLFWGWACHWFVTIWRFIHLHRHSCPIWGWCIRPHLWGRGWLLLEPFPSPQGWQACPHLRWPKVTRDCLPEIFLQGSLKDIRDLCWNLRMMELKTIPKWRWKWRSYGKSSLVMARRWWSPKAEGKIRKEYSSVPYKHILSLETLSLPSKASTRIMTCSTPRFHYGKHLLPGFPQPVLLLVIWCLDYITLSIHVSETHKCHWFSLCINSFLLDALQKQKQGTLVCFFMQKSM